MKAAAARTVLLIDFSSKRPHRATVTPTGRLPRVTRMLALAHKIDAMVLAGVLRQRIERLCSRVDLAHP